MKSPSILILNKSSTGFTLIEILVVLAILMGLSAAGLIIGIDAYQRYLFRADLSKATALLQKARSSAMSNIGETSHGVYFGDPEKFVLFRGTAYGLLPSYDLSVEKSKAVTATSIPVEIVFTPLSGTTTDGTIAFGDGVRNTTITINHEGGINW